MCHFCSLGAAVSLVFLHAIMPHVGMPHVIMPLGATVSVVFLHASMPHVGMPLIFKPNVVMLRVTVPLVVAERAVSLCVYTALRL